MMPVRIPSLSVVALAGLAAGCAAATPGELNPSAQTTRTVITDTNGLPEGLTSAAPVASRAHSPVPVDSTLVLLQAAYATAMVPVTLVEPAQHRLGNPRFSVRSRLNGEPLSRVVGCGRALGTDHADRDQVFISIISTVRPGANGGSEVETLLTANAQDRTSGTAGEMITCQTTGVLETRIHTAAFGAH
jgi:hypothetical protein